MHPRLRRPRRRRYTADRADLIEGLRDALADGQPVDHLFSRKRSFTLQRKKAARRAVEADVRGR